MGYGECNGKKILENRKNLKFLSKLLVFLIGKYYIEKK